MVSNLEKRLWDSDDASPLTHEAAREIERLNWIIKSCLSRAEAAEADRDKLRAIVEYLTDDLTERGEKIVELYRSLDRLSRAMPEALALIMFDDLKRQFDVCATGGNSWMDVDGGLTDVVMDGKIDLVSMAQAALSALKEPS
jgi:hypothetical protein